MGVFHFMGLGRSIGVVTCAIDYIEKALDKLNQEQNPSENLIKLFSGSGGINHTELDKGKIEAIVLFTSKEVIDNEINAFSYTGKDQPSFVRNELVGILKKIWKRGDKDEGRKIYWCEVEIDNFRDCLEKAIKVAYRFSRPGKQGKEIWCNLTGGTNAINLALITMSELTGASIKTYLISQRKEYQREISVPQQININPNQDEYFNTLPFLKTHLDNIHFYDILGTLKKKYERDNDKVKTEDLLGVLKSEIVFFNDVNEERFKKDFMLKLYGLGYTNFDNEGNWITNEGNAFLDELKVLEESFDIEEFMQEKIDIVEESKEWEWFKVDDNLDKE